MSATNNLIAYGGGAQIACTLTSLASGSARESAVQSNASNKYFDYLVAVTFTIASGTPSTANPAVNIYASGSVDGTIWPIIQGSGGATVTTGTGDSSAGALSVSVLTQLKLLGTFAIQTTTSAGERTFRTQAYSIARGFDGTLPVAFSVLVENITGVVFSTSTATTAQYVEVNGVYTTSGN